jgi:hypothetical protein
MIDDVNKTDIVACLCELLSDFISLLSSTVRSPVREIDDWKIGACSLRFLYRAHGG